MVELALYRVPFSQEIPYYSYLLQCSCVSVFSCIFSFWRDNTLWFKDLDCLFTWADPIYKSLQTDSFLKLEEIPKEAKILGIQIELEFIKNKYGMLYQNQTNHLNTWVLGWALHSFHICYCWNLCNNNSMWRLCLFIWLSQRRYFWYARSEYIFDKYEVW